MGIVKVLRIALSHSIAAGIVMVVSAILAVTSYLAMLVWSVVFDEPLGGPFALPVMIVMAMVGSGLCAALMFAPVTVAAESLVLWRSRPAFFQIPVASALLLLEVIAVAAFVTLVWDLTARVAVTWAAGGGLVLLALFGVYWWSVKSAHWLMALGFGLVSAVGSLVRTRARGRAR